MALWQYAFQLIPKNCGITDGDVISRNELSVDMNFWQPINFNKIDTSEINAVLPMTKSWSKDLVLFGTIDSSFISFYLENKLITEVELRIDLRKDLNGFLRKLSLINFLHDVLLIDEVGYVSKFNMPLIVHKIINSIHYANFNKIMNG